MSAFESAGTGMPGEENREEVDARLLRELSVALERAARREKRLNDRLDEAIGVMREVSRNQRDIKEIHRDLYGPDGLMGRVKVLERHPTVQFSRKGEQEEEEESGGIRLSNTSLVTVALFIISAALSGLWQILSWIIELARAVGR